MINGYPIIFVFWNIFLALIPCAIAYFLVKHKVSMPVFALLFIVWFFFFPNTAYLFTAVRYLVDYCEPMSRLRVCPSEAWIPPVFFLYASIGIPTFIYALKRMTQTLAKRFHKYLSIIFPIIMIPITAVGTLLGLVDRFNSWNIVQYPLKVAKVGLGYFADPIMLRNVAAYSALMYFIYYLIPKSFKYVCNDSR